MKYEALIRKCAIDVMTHPSHDASLIEMMEEQLEDHLLPELGATAEEIETALVVFRSIVNAQGEVT